MSIYIKNEANGLYLRTDIDSGGMSVMWTSKHVADDFETRDHADSFVRRLREHYPLEKFEIKLEA